MEANGLTTRNSYSTSLYAIEEFSVLGTCKVQEDTTGCWIKDNCSIMVLCDGIGGLERGDLASRAAVEAVISNAEKYDWKDNPIEFLRCFVESANETVFNLCDESGTPIQGGCTLVIILTIGRRLYVANVGDSRAYLLKRDAVVRLTQDHTFAEQLNRQLRAKLITQKEYEAGISRGAALTSYIGMGILKECFICSEAILLDRDEIVLIESDGLYKLLSDEEVARIIRKKVRCLDEAGTELIIEAQKHVLNYQDNTSFILFRIK